MAATRQAPNVVPVQPSSLVFLVIIAIWAAYFVQHWVRRREHLATARSVDRFSESMRVLEQRAALPVADLSVPQPRSYAVSPARVARPEILVKRAVRAPEAAPAADTTTPAAQAGPAASSAAASAVSSAVVSAMSSRRVRGLTLLGSLAALVVTLGLAALGVLPWLAVLGPVAAVAGALVWVRSGVKAAQAARRAAREGAGARAGAVDRSARGAAGRAAAPQRPARAQHEQRSARPNTQAAAPAQVSTRSAGSPPETALEPAEPEPVAARESFYDLQAVERGAAVATEPAVGPVAVAQATPAVPLVDEDDIPLTWDPVPVPRPTYTMKAVAHRTEAPPVGHGVPPELADAAYEEPVRRVAGA